MAPKNDPDTLRLVTTESNIGDPFLINRCLSGEVLVIRRFLQRIEAHDLVRETVMSAAKTVNQNVAQRIESLGFDKLHDLLSVDEIIQLMPLTQQRLFNVVQKLYKIVLRRGLGYWGPIWVQRRPIIRFFIPQDWATKHRRSIEQFQEKYGQGRLTVLRPHRDIWFKEPSTCINVWISLGTVVPGNGLSIFPEDYTNALSYVEERGVTRDQPVTRPVNVLMNEGDALFFHASQLHASEINYSDLTRTVLSLRLAVDDPKLSSSTPQRYCQVDSRVPLSFWSLHSNKSTRRWLQRLFRLFPVTTTAPLKPFLLAQRKETASIQSPGFRPPQKGPVSDAELSSGQPLAISERHFLVKLEQEGEQQIWRLDRRCPHEGADLALGYVEDHYIRCPWHNLPIDIRTGRSACKSLDSIETHLCTIRDGQVKLS